MEQLTECAARGTEDLLSFGARKIYRLFSAENFHVLEMGFLRIVYENTCRGLKYRYAANKVRNLAPEETRGENGRRYQMHKLALLLRLFGVNE